MLGEFARRLLIALPLVSLLAVLAILVLRRLRGTGGPAGLPGILGGLLPGAPAAAAPLLLEVRSVTPAARLAVVRFDGRDLLIGVSAQSFTLLASSAPLPHQEENP